MYKLNKIFFLSALALTVAMSLMGCGGAATTTANKTEANKTTTTTENKTTTTEANKTTTTEANKTGDTPKNETAGKEKIGVPECDEYIEKYEACLFDKVPEAQRAMYKPTLETMRKSWKDAASTPQGKSAMATGCKQALETAKTSMASFGCKW